MIVLAVECMLHLVPHGSLLGYGEGIGTYYEVKHAIGGRGVAPIVILGDSRAQEAVSMPKLAAQASARLGRTVVAANYARPDATALDMLLIAETMLASKSKPALVFYLISPRSLLGTERSVQREEDFGVFPNQFGVRTAQVLASLTEYPMWQARNAIEECCLTFPHRYRFRNFLATTLQVRHSLSRIQGEETTWQRHQPSRSIVTNPVSFRHIEALRRIGRLCHENTLDLVFVNVPIADDLLRHMPSGSIEKSDRAMRVVAREFDLLYLTVAELSVSLDRTEFGEQFHLNRHGAEKFAAALVNRVIVPAIGTSSTGIPAASHGEGASR